MNQRGQFDRFPFLQVQTRAASARSNTRDICIGFHGRPRNDDDFTHFVRHATEVTARIGLDYETKTAKTGALFYQEFLPAETLFYSVILVSAARTKIGNGRAAPDLLQTFRTHLPAILQAGGDETTGKGLCARGCEKWGTRCVRKKCSKSGRINKPVVLPVQAFQCLQGRSKPRVIRAEGNRLFVGEPLACQSAYRHFPGWFEWERGDFCVPTRNSHSSDDMS